MKGTLLLALILIAPAYSFATGAISAGGGQAVVCRNQQGKITSAISMDLYEGENLYGLHIKYSMASLVSQIQTALSVIPIDSREAVATYVTSVQKYLSFADVPLTPISDPSPVEPPPNCAIEQFANYYNDTLILVDQEIWNSIDDTSRAALIMHESVYAANRNVGATDSRQSRHVVASLFAEGTQWADVRAGVPSGALTCILQTGGQSMWAFHDKAGNWTLQFQILGNGLVMSKKTVTFTAAEVNFNDAAKPPVQWGVANIGKSSSVSANAQSAFENGDTINIEQIWEPLKNQMGNIVPGYQILHYYFSWESATYPKTSSTPGQLNCGIQIPESMTRMPEVMHE